jgi:hypothetical protein
VCPWERLVIISYTTGLSFALERIRPLAAIITIVFYLLILYLLYLLALPNTPENLFASIYSESLIKTTCQHFLHLVGFDTLIYRKYYDTPPILVGHHLSGSCCLSSRSPWSATGGSRDQLLNLGIMGLITCATPAWCPAARAGTAARLPVRRRPSFLFLVWFGSPPLLRSRFCFAVWGTRSLLIFFCRCASDWSLFDLYLLFIQV